MRPHPLAHLQHTQMNTIAELNYAFMRTDQFGEQRMREVSGR